MSEETSTTKPEADHGVNEATLVMLNSPASPGWEQAAEVEAEVFIEIGYVESREELDEEYEPYLPDSHILAVLKADEVIGCTRFIDYNPEVGFKTINDAKNERIEISPEGYELLGEVNPEEMVEVGTISLKQEHRSGVNDEVHTITQLYAGIYQYSLDHDKPYVLASFDEDYLNRFGSLFGPAVKRLGPPVDYMKSPTVPVLMNVKEAAQYLESIDAKEFVESLLEIGRGIRHEL